MKKIAITGSQITAARALTETSRERLATHSQVDLSTLVDLENRRNAANDPSAALTKIHQTLEELGAVFIPERRGAGVGVHLRFGRSQTRAIDRWEDKGGAPADDEVL